jgi:ubiquinone/menaquinone biosynthesis C-methylase UbiE
VRGDAHALPFPNGVFSIVLCNSAMHHARNPVAMLREIFRVAAPSRLLLHWHLWRHGRQYRGEMRRLFEASVKAAYTAEELEGILRQAGTRGASIFKYRGAHIGIERAGS